MASRARNQCVSGFTLIEIVISVGIVLLMLSGVVVNYNNYNDTQQLKQAALTLKNDFRFLQSKALTGEKPIDPSGTQTPDQFCRQLVGYQVTFALSNYRYQAQCSPNQPNAPIVTVNLPSGITFSQYPSPFTFLVVSRGTSLSGITNIRLTGSNHTYQVTVSSSGDISDDGIQ